MQNGVLHISTAGSTSQRGGRLLQPKAEVGINTAKEISNTAINSSFLSILFSTSSAFF
jgi:hypothetical protein